jgi:hypothetical protein
VRRLAPRDSGLSDAVPVFWRKCQIPTSMALIFSLRPRVNAEEPP